LFLNLDKPETKKGRADRPRLEKTNLPVMVCFFIFLGTPANPNIPAPLCPFISRVLIIVLHG